MNILRLVTLLVAFTALHAQRPVSLPSGDIVAYGKIQCGQVKDKWIPGQIQGNGTFLSFAAQVSRLNKQKRTTIDPARIKKLNKQIKNLRSRAKSQADTCLLFGPRVNKPKGAQTILPGYTQINGAHNLTSTSYVVGSTYDLYCPPNTVGGSIWGTYTYTADSSACSAAVHVGLFKQSTGGNFKVKVKPGQDLYLPSLRNSITSLEYRNYTKSYVFLNAVSLEEISSSVPNVFSWSGGITGFRPLTGNLYTFVCPAAGTIGSVWGTDTYTDDSIMCSAAVHARKISAKKGGVVNVRIRAGGSSYVGSTRSGVASQSYGAWGGSYSFE